MDKEENEENKSKEDSKEKVEDKKENGKGSIDLNLNNEVNEI